MSTLPTRPVRCSAFLASAVFLGAAGFCAKLPAAPYAVPDGELFSDDFTKIPGYSGSTSSLNLKVNDAAPGVLFYLTLSGPDSGKMGIGDPWPTNSLAGFGWDPVLHHYTSLAAYSQYQMSVRYVSGPANSDVDIGLIMNTGLTGPSGYPSNDWTNDTFWASPWVNLRVGQTATLVLDFNAAEAWNVSDNKVPHTGGGLGWANGGIYAINDRDRNEVSNIGVQLADWDGDAMGQAIALELNAIPEPGAFALLLSGLLGLIAVGFVRRRR